MTRRLVGLLALLAACGGSPPESTDGTNTQVPDLAAPVATNADAPVQYPPALYDQGISGEVVLRLFVDSTGRVVRDSSRIETRSGHAALDSAALAGASALTYSPARRRGLAIATWFLQPIEFRHPDRSTLPEDRP